MTVQGCVPYVIPSDVLLLHLDPSIFLNPLMPLSVRVSGCQKLQMMTTHRAQDAL